MFSSTRFMFARATAAASVPKRDFTRVTAIGHVGNEPELRAFEGGSKVISFSLAVERKAPSAKQTPEQRKKNTMWFRVFFFDDNPGLTKVVDEKVTKGSLVLVDGELTQRLSKGAGGFEHTFTDIHIGNGLGRIRVLRTPSNGGAKDAGEGAKVGADAPAATA